MEVQDRIERIERVVIILAEAMTGESPMPSVAALKLVLDGALDPAE